MIVLFYNQLSSRADIKWFCPMCKETVEKNLKADRQIEEKCRLVLCFVSCTLFGFSTLLHVFFMISWTSSLVTKLSALTSSVFNLSSTVFRKSLHFSSIDEVQDIINNTCSNVENPNTVNETKDSTDTNVNELVIKEMSERKKRKNITIMFPDTGCKRVLNSNHILATYHFFRKVSVT
jgi:hypothetical protein